MTKNFSFKKLFKALVIIALILAVSAAIVVPSVLYGLGYIDYAEPAQGSGDYYIMAYFHGNTPAEERISFAISDDGYNFTPLRGGEPMAEQTTGTGCARDPYIMKGEDGYYYLLATDMRSELGWTANHAIVTWKSSDLVNWVSESNIDLHDYSGYEDVNRAWAPQAIWDESKNLYMVYYSSSVWEEEGVSSKTQIWRAYTRDFTSFITDDPALAPAPYFAPASGADAIDADIVKAGDTYYMYYKDQGLDDICLATSSSLDGEWEERGVVNVRYQGVEGSFIYNIAGTKEWVMWMDSYKYGRFFMQQTSDMINFKRAKKSDYSANFSPRHGSVVAISEEEYTRLLNNLT